jgi:hypothetical protein
MKKKYEGLSLLEFQERFSTEKACMDYLIQTRWPEGFSCHCKSKNFCFSPTRSEFHCYECDAVTSPTAGTLFHRSKVSLRKWFWVMFLVGTSKKGVSALYIKRELKVHYRTAWSMLRKIRLSMANRDAQWNLKGTIQADEIFVGGKQTNEQRRKNPNKTPFFIAVEEDSVGRPKFLGAQEIESAYDEKSLRPAVEKQIPDGSTLKTDGKGVYREVAMEKNCVHEQVIAMKDPVLAHEHLNWVNIVTSNLKRWLISTHHGVFPKYRAEYVAEFVYRFNRRYWPDQAFDRLLFANIFKGPTPLRGLCA